MKPLMGPITTSITAQRFPCSGEFLSPRSPLLQTYEQIKLIEENSVLISQRKYLQQAWGKLFWKWDDFWKKSA